MEIQQRSPLDSMDTQTDLEVGFSHTGKLFITVQVKVKYIKDLVNAESLPLLVAMWQSLTRVLLAAKISEIIKRMNFYLI